jgi:predicted amidohydrolase YtcJ
LRFYVYLPTQLLKATVSLGLRSGLGDSWVRIGGIKVFTDGSLGARTAALEEPYSDDPENRGVAIYTQQQLDEIISEAHRSELQIACHVIGDRAMSMALEAYSKAFEAMPANKNMRHRIEHLSVTNANLLERMRKLNLIASVQPHFTVSDFWIPERLGPERATQTNAYQSILKAGMTVVGGSDCPVEPLAPLTGIEAAVNRQGPEAVSVYSAISFYTRNAAYASFDEAEKGTITAGKLADLVILQLDPREIPAGEISKIPILTTIVGGRIRHPRPARS